MPDNNTTSLYGTSQSTTNIAGSNLTSLYPTDNVPVPPLTGDLVVAGNLIVQGGNIITDAATASIFNTTATTVNIGGNATTVSIGANTGTTTINNNLAIGGTFSAPNASFTNLTVTNPIVGQVTSLANHTTTDVAEGTNLYYTTSRARSAISAGTGISYNASTGVITNTGGGGGGAVNSVNGLTGTVVLTTTNIAEGTNLYYTNARARGALSAGAGISYNSTTGVISATSTGGVVSVNGQTGVVTLTSDNIPQGVTNLYFSNALARAALSGGTGVTYNSTTGVIAIGQDVAPSASPNFVNMTLSGDIAVNGGDITTSATTFNLLNSTATTLNVGGAATAVNIGAATGTTAIKNSATVAGTLGVTGNTTLTGDLAVNGGDITTTATTFNLINTTATTANIAGAATAITIGAVTGSTTVRNPLTATRGLLVASTIGAPPPGYTSGLWIDHLTASNTGRFYTAGATGNFSFRNNLDTTATTLLNIDSSGNLNAYGTSVRGNTGQSGAPTLNFSLIAERGSSPDTSIRWYETTDKWQLTNDGTTFGDIATTANVVTSITGTANQIIVSSPTGAVTLSTPQDIATTSSPQFANMTLSGDLAVNGGDITTTATGVATVFNTTATTVNIGGDATILNVGKVNQGAISFNNADNIFQNVIYANGGSLQSTAPTFNFLTAGVPNTIINMGSATTTDINVGVTGSSADLNLNLYANTYIEDNLEVHGSTFFGNNYIADVTEVTGKFSVNDSTHNYLIVDPTTNTLQIGYNNSSVTDVKGALNVGTINSANGTACLTLTNGSGSLTVAGPVILGGDTLKSSDNTTVATTSAGSITFTNNLTVNDDTTLGINPADNQYLHGKLNQYAVDVATNAETLAVQVNTQTLTTSTTTANQFIFTVPNNGAGGNAWAGGKFVIMVTSGTEFHMIEMLVLVQNSTDSTWTTQYAELYSSTPLATFGAHRVSNGTWHVNATPVNAVTTFKTTGTLIAS